jgi:hypothetical protein
MLEWTAAGRRASPCSCITTTPLANGPDRGSPVGALDAAWAEALKHWTIVSMKKDWKTIFRVIEITSQ